MKMRLVLWCAVLVPKSGFGAVAPGPGPFGSRVLPQPVPGARRGYDVDRGWKTGKQCEMDASLNNTNATAALQAAIDACGDRPEGGTVLVRNQTRLHASSLWLRSNLTLRIEAGSAIVGTATGSGNKSDPTNTNITDAPMVYTRRMSLMAWGHAGLLNGGRCSSTKEPAVGWDDCAKWTKLENVVIEGGGLIDGNAEGWIDEWPGFDSNTRPMLLDLLWIDGLTLRDVTVLRSGYWTVHPTFCNNVRMENVKVVTHGENTDGLDPDSVWNMYVAGCVFDNDDDCIAVKSGRDWSGRMVNISSRNILAEYNTYLRGHGVAVGSETSAGVVDVVFRHSTLNGTDKSVRVKSARGRGGVIRNIRYQNLTGTVKAALSLTLEYTKDLPPTNDTATPEIDGVSVGDVHLVATGDDHLESPSSTATWTYLECIGLNDAPITAVSFSNVHVSTPLRRTPPPRVAPLASNCSFCHGTATTTLPRPCFSPSPTYES